MYILKLDKLEAGDIFLTAQKGIVSKGVKVFTKSDYSHAMLYVGDGSYIHSNGKGVHSGSTQRLTFNKPEYIRVLRVTSAFNAKSVCDYARREIGKEYSVKEALKTKNKLSQKKPENRQFCSRLVAEAFKYSGFDLVNNSHYCSPQEIDNSVHTIEVKDCIKLMTGVDIEHEKSDSPIDRQTAVTNEILKAARNITKSDIQTLEGLTEFIISNNEFDNDISGIIENSGFLTFSDDDKNKNPWRYNSDIFVNLSAPKIEIRKHAKFEVESSKSRIERFGNMLTQYESLHSRYKLRFTSIHVDLYKKLLAMSLLNLKTAQEVVERT